MNLKRILFFISALVFLTFASGVQAQYRWHTTHKESIPPIIYKFTAIGAQGLHCTAGGLVIDSSKKFPALRVMIMFFRSDDGGRTWHDQDPKLPAKFDEGGPWPRYIQQIDSLNIIATGDSGMCLRSADAGVSWKQLPVPTKSFVKDMHFSDALTGTIFTYGFPNVFTTSDGGEHWLSTTVPGFYPPYCGAHSFGGGRFRGVSYAAGPIFNTNDYWRSFDSDIIYPLADTIHLIRGCNYSSTGDTMVAYGVTEDRTFHEHLLMTRSADGGKHWKALDLPDYPIGANYFMSSLDSTPVFFGGHGRLHILMSKDHGTTWTNDSVRFDSAGFSFSLLVNSAVRGLASTERGGVVAILGGLAIGVPNTESVESYERVTIGTHLYPNPATDVVKITSVDAYRPIQMLDMLGREVLRDELSAQGTLTMDVSHLPRGCYEVILDHFGVKLRIGKVAVIGKE